jgi:transketolase
LRAILRASLDRPGAMYIRLGRGRDPEVYPEVPADFEIGKAIRLREGDAATVITTGAEVWACARAIDRLASEGVAVRLVDMHTISPIDRGEILAAGRDTSLVVTVEEHNLSGGLGSAVAETLMDAGVHPRFHRIAVPDEHVVIGPPAALYAHYGLDAEGIESTLRHLLTSGGDLR